MKVKDTQANTDRTLTWQYHCQIVSKERSITSNKNEHLILIQVQSSKKMRILNLNVPNNITSKYQYIKTDRGTQNYRKHFILLKEGKSKEHRLGGTNRKHTATWCLHTEYQHYKQSQYSN